VTAYETHIITESSGQIFIWHLVENKILSISGDAGNLNVRISLPQKPVYSKMKKRISTLCRQY
jgi:hypothetical protein